MRTLVKRGRQLADWVILERKMYTILIVEDDLHINNLLKEALGKAGYACSQAFSGTEALLWLEHNECQLILLDLMLPGLSGEEVLQQIRQTSNVPVIVLTAKGEMEEKLDLLTSGADDYMTKPFDVKEVIARVQIQLRHLQHGAGEESTHLKCRGMDLDKETHRVMIDGQELGHLTRQEFAILELLLEHPGQVFSKEAVFTYAWQEEYMGEKRYIISDASKMLNVESHVLRYWEEELEIKIPRNEMGHRYYTEDNIESLRKVRDLKKQGYSLKAIKNMVNPKKATRENKESNERLTVRQPISLMEVREKKVGVENCYQEVPEAMSGSVQSVVQNMTQSNGQNAESAGLKLEQFQNLMNKVVSKALKESTTNLGKELSDNVSENVLKGMNYMMRVQDEKEEERYRKLDELMRNKQKLSRREKRKKAKAEKLLLKNKKKGMAHFGKKPQTT